eukprot:TRINITY_DN7045_c0_g1_i1.p1 TRINITY_DN7045_c0_g1~~TRINITY_DN7045_c0_g1_i1.p1  ORF type:complete len:255 (-),score=15.95 TRINITY_DN7045_c0_g1_i1:373-1137(-)
MSSTSAVALITLGLAGTPSKSILQRRYHQLAREHHPGKAVLRGICPAEATAKFREIHSAYDFLKRHVKHSNPASARDRCVSCGSMALMLNEHRCTAAGIDWLEYAGHPARLRTCMRCKASHKSVLTEAQACKAFEELSSGNDLFRVLEREGCVFRDASETYFERLDLEKNFLAATKHSASWSVRGVHSVMRRRPTLSVWTWKRRMTPLGSRASRSSPLRRRKNRRCGVELGQPALLHPVRRSTSDCLPPGSCCQ